MEGAFIGTELKFRIEIEAGGFSMVDDDFTVTIKRGSKQKVFAKADLARDGEDNFYVFFDSAEFGSGMIQAVVTAYVPDTDFPDGLRTEVYLMDLVNVKRV